MDYRLDPVKRMFHELHELDGELCVRYHIRDQPDSVTERNMRYREYRLWLANAATNGLELEWVETVKKEAS